MFLLINSYNKIQTNILYFGGLVETILMSNIWGVVISSGVVSVEALVFFTDVY